jgi:hypothetical protein
MFDEYKNGTVKILSILPALDYKTCTEFGITVHVVVFSFLRWSFAFSLNRLKSKPHQVEEGVITIDDDLVNRYDHRYFFDLENPDRVEVVEFYKSFGNSLGMRCSGASSDMTYDHSYLDPQGTHKSEDTYCYSYIKMIESGSHLLREISHDQWDKAMDLIDKQKEIVEAKRNDFDRRRIAVLANI